ncbi:MAG TPA: C40 family peptidase [Pyrinomonadaceae bacterium]|jgi:peptidoglycan endopeptidase LytE|nr:C40 family peptidase [Pyrinomonadaceae bacterium]
MSLCKVFPRSFAVCFVLSLLALSAHAQQTLTRPRVALQVSQTTTRTTQTDGRTRLENDLAIAPQEQDEADDAGAPAESVEGFVIPSSMGHVERLMLTAIEERLGTPYRMGATGPNRFDCSGFVWSVFQQAGVSFERSSARSLWQEFAPPVEGEQYKFGTLVFFRNLRHVGIVADANGFFHASSHGVVYSRFNDYWTKRLTGFRRIPIAQSPSLVASAGK